MEFLIEQFSYLHAKANEELNNSNEVSIAYSILLLPQEQW